MTDTAAFFSPSPGAPRLAYLARAGNVPPGLFWLGGFRSDMRGSKAQFLDSLAEAQSRPCLRFDYSGHGKSDGAFADGTIGKWAAQALAVFRALTRGPQIVVGSSMGGWIALLLARALADAGESARLAGMVLIAPAVDFTEELIWPRLPEEARRAIVAEGRWTRPADAYGEAYPLTRALFEDGKVNSLFGREIRTHCPVAILQGMEDPDVPWRHAMRLMESLASDPATIALIKDGDHRLSRPQDLAALARAIETLEGQPRGG
ncbi:alpha/beta hydrolase [Candidatus Rhodoblastus alkanivorans]|uniref:Palmitoyl-protein thioesterase ABHD10, mitochondrial n=1 Tax=Candidatus Rhodoblastus alkanivorans TaxID=2954117 RepID=A0ABS9Z1V3_9HYPH|nr:alpha/beta hydrolase [Candidatus Rhodoblastus alkanivorans]MCI4681619.1 alpha/beta hydrolase [Candidatus Rhodoblastus alkanivorans]